MATGDQMKLRLPGLIISMAGVACFVDAFHIWPGVGSSAILTEAWSNSPLTAALGIIFFLHVLSPRPRRADVVIAACVLAGLYLAGNHGLLNGRYNPFWIVLAGGAPFRARLAEASADPAAQYPLRLRNCPMGAASFAGFSKGPAGGTSFRLGSPKPLTRRTTPFLRLRPNHCGCLPPAVPMVRWSHSKDDTAP